MELYSYYVYMLSRKKKWSSNFDFGVLWLGEYENLKLMP